jgi:hypothetical protein
LSGYEDKVSYHENIEFPAKKNDVVIIDEADLVIFKDPKKFMAFSLKASIICLTASTPDVKSGALEESVFKRLGMKTF